MPGVTSSPRQARLGEGLEAPPERALRRGYDAFNQGDIESALSLMCDDVDWPNTVEGGRERGRDAVHDYWTRLFGLLIPRVEPLQLGADRQGRLVVDAHLVFSDSATGQPLAHQRARHVYRFRGALIVRMDAREPLRLDPSWC